MCKIFSLQIIKFFSLFIILIKIIFKLIRFIILFNIIRFTLPSSLLSIIFISRSLNLFKKICFFQKIIRKLVYIIYVYVKI